MTFLQSWKNSFLLVFNIQFWIACFKTIVKTYIFLLKYCWWYIGLAIILRVFLEEKQFGPLPDSPAFNDPDLLILTYSYDVVVWIVFVYLVYLGVYYALGRTQTRYQACVSFLYFIILWFGGTLGVAFALFFSTMGWFFVVVPPYLVPLYYTILFTLAALLSLSPIFHQSIYDMQYVPLFAFAVFFIVNAKGKLFSSLYNAFMMFLYNIPFCLMAFLIFNAVIGSSGIYVGFFPGNFNGSVSWLLIQGSTLIWGVNNAKFINTVLMMMLPIPIGIFGTFYNRMIRDQSKLYSLK